MVGKWHLGVGTGGRYLPTKHGFDHYFGIPYSHDMCPCPVCFPPGSGNSSKCSLECQPDDSFVACPTFDDEEIVAQPTNLLTLTQQYTRRAVDFIEGHADQPFFLYMAYHQTHHPQFANEPFYRSSDRGPFGDALNEMDHSVGQIMNTLRQNGLVNNTLVLFTSDNG